MVGVVKRCPHCGEQAWDGAPLSCGYALSRGRCDKTHKPPRAPKKPRRFRKGYFGVKGFRGEPWSTDGKYIYDRNGDAFAEVFFGEKEFARTIVMCVNLLTNLPLRKGDLAGKKPDGTPARRTALQQHALAILKDQAKLWGDDPR